MKKMKIILKYLFQAPVTFSFTQKLKQNFHCLAWGEVLIYFIFLRPFKTKRERFFFEADLRLHGQMYAAERQALFNLVIDYKPNSCFEIGTYTGAGSTFFISAALGENGNGMLYSSEINTFLFNRAKKHYENKLSEQAAHIKFILNENPNCFIPYLSDGRADFVFFDGAEDAKQTLDQFEFFKPYLTSGSVIAFHDWNTDKTADVKPLILADSSWEKIDELTPPDSVGFASFKKV